MSQSLEPGDLTGFLEENILTALCWNDDIAPLIAARIPGADVFSTRLSAKIAEKALEHLYKHHKAPGVHLPDLLERELQRDSGLLLRDIIGGMEQTAKKLQADFVLEQLDTFIERQQIMQMVERAGDLAQSYKLNEAREALHTISALRAETDGIWLHKPEQSLAFLDQTDSDLFSSGISALDELGIVPARKTMWCLIGTAKSGKSWHLIALGKSAVMMHKSVLHVTLENSGELTSRRYIQALFGMTKRRAQIFMVPMFERDSKNQRLLSIRHEEIEAKGLADTERQKLNRMVRNLNRRPPLLIKEFATGTLTITRLNMYLDMLKRVHGFEPDMMLLDYPDLMSTSSENLRVDLGRIFVNLRGIGVDRNMAVGVVSQGHRASFTAAKLHAGMVAEDYSKIGTADTMLAYSQTQDERERGLARLSVEAARDEMDKFTVMLTQSYATGQFCLDSIFMSKNVEQIKQQVITDGYSTNDSDRPRTDEDED